MLVELREYEIAEGAMADFVKVFDEEVVPYQTSKGIVFLGSYVSEENPNTFIWLRGFKDQAELDRIYKAIYESEHWLTVIKPKVADILLKKKGTLIRPTSAGQAFIDRQA